MTQLAQKQQEYKVHLNVHVYLGYITLVLGLKIPRDDEDFNSGMFERFFTAAGFFVKFGFIKTLPFEDKPFSFESKKEAIELWEKHFPEG